MVQMAPAGSHHLFPDFSGQHHNQQFQIPMTSTNPNLTLSSSQQTSASLPSLQQQHQNPIFSSSSECKQNKSLSPMSATALLQKAAQMGSTRSNSTNAPSIFAGATMTSSPSAASHPPPRSSSPMMIQQQLNNNFNTNVSRENQNLAPPNSGVTTSSVAKNNQFQTNGSGLNPAQQMGLTRDFLGVSNEYHPHRTSHRPSQELARFSPLG